MKKILLVLTLFMLAFSSLTFAESEKGNAPESSYGEASGNCEGGACAWRR